MVTGPQGRVQLIFVKWDQKLILYPGAIERPTLALVRSKRLIFSKYMINCSGTDVPPQKDEDYLLRWVDTSTITKPCAVA